MNRNARPPIDWNWFFQSDIGILVQRWLQTDKTGISTILALYSGCKQLFHSEARRYFLQQIPIKFNFAIISEYNVRNLILSIGDEQKLLKIELANLKSIFFRGELDPVAMMHIDFKNSKWLEHVPNVKELNFESCFISHFWKIKRLSSLRKVSISRSQVDFKGRKGTDFFLDSVQELTLRECNFKNGSSFENLKKLYISGAKRVQYICKVGTLHALEQLTVIDSRMDGILCLPSLKHASFRNVEWPEIYDLSKSTVLETLVLENIIRIPSDLDDFWTYFKSLKELVIDCTGIAITSIGTLPSLHTLTIHHNRIGFPLFLKSNPQLRKLVMKRLEAEDCCGFWNLFPKYCKNLKELSLERPFLVHLSSIPLFTQLERLEIHSPRTPIESVKVLYPMSRLKYLTISFGNVRTVESFRHLTSLVELRLPYNQIRTIKNIDYFPLLRYLDVTGNCIRKTTIEVSRQVLIKWK
jgi:Leucine-rich repeat (LRR) protein